MPQQPAHSPLNSPTRLLTQAYPLGLGTQRPIESNPMFGRPAWSYVRLQQSPRMGPQPRLAKGSKPTPDHALPGNTSRLPGYLTDQEYEPNLFDYQPQNKQTHTALLPRSVALGVDGRELVGTYRPHDFVPGTRVLGSLRSTANWQVMQFAPNFRNLLAWQQVRRYRVESLTLSARPLDSSQYFLGYQVNPDIVANIGMSGLGYMGSK